MKKSAKEKADKTSTPNDAAEKTGQESDGKKDFIVVGLGASAGGVRALQQFFATMPPNSGMAFVVILHLSPEHESSLAEIIQSQTTMPVIKAVTEHKVEPNRVYVIPPNAQLEMTDGVVRCEELVNERGRRAAIDVFFRTLADVYEKNAVCIILSGTGTDGTIGLKAVKGVNGFAIVQDPTEAEHDSMPRSAIGTKVVDWILPVREMPEKLLQFRARSERLHLTTDGNDRRVAAEIQADDSLREILTVLRVRTGHDFSNYKTPTLIRRIARHLQIHDLPDIPAYLDFLKTKPGEINSLLKNLLINVTNFFRDAESWASLEHEIIPKLFSGKRAGDTVRVWSCGCASGEESYTLAMLLAEYAERLSDPPKVQVFATDVDEDAISEAREQRYPLSIETDVSPERLKRFFVKDGKYYRVKKELREMVLFAPHNVLRDPPFSRLDLIVCRNLLIYLNRETQERVMEIFHFALATHGFLFLGSSETTDSVTHLFLPVDKKHRIYARRPVSLTQKTGTPQMPISGRWEVKAPEYRAKQRDAGGFFGEMQSKLLESLAPPSVLVNQDYEIQYMSQPAGRFLSFKGGEPSTNLLKLINTDLLPDLRAALFSVQRENNSAEFKDVRVRIDGEETLVTLVVRPVELEGETTDFLLVIFDENNKLKLPNEPKRKEATRLLNRDEETESIIRRLEEELKRTKDTLRATIEQHEVAIEEQKASNEELQAINEELRSTTEELETSKEELQSVNEDLTTVNHEHKEKIEETTRAYSDLQNLMVSTEIATIFLDREQRIKRLTTPVEQLFNITTDDVGRPLDHFTHRLDYRDLLKDAAEVLRTLTPKEREIRADDDKTFLARFVPYRTLDDRIEGVVLNFIDITERKSAEDERRKTQERLRLMMESVADYAMIFTDPKGIVTAWNKGAEKVFGWAESEMLGRSADIVFLAEDIERGVPEQERQTALKQGRAEDERLHRHKNGSHFYASGVMTPLKDGGMEGFIKICRDQTEQLRAENALRDREILAQLVSTQEEERRRIAREIHDHLGQQVTTLRLKLESVRERCEDHELCDDLDEIGAITARLDRDVDFLAWELRPVALDDLGLLLALGNFVKEWSKYSGIEAEFNSTGFARAQLDFETETNLYRIAQEALNNIQKHARATRVSVLLNKKGANVSLIVEDDGVGFNPKDKKNRTQGIGLVGMSERAKLSGGKLEIESAKGKGTTVFVRLTIKKQ